MPTYNQLIEALIVGLVLNTVRILKSSILIL